MRGTLGVLFVLLIGWSVVAVAARSGADEPKRRSFKGWEVYAVTDGDALSFAFLPGTNRQKDPVEIQKAVIGGVAELRSQLDTLAAGEFVTFQNKAGVPPKMLGDLVTYAKKLDLKVVGD